MAAERQAELAAAAARKAEAEEAARRAEDARKAKQAAEEEVFKISNYTPINLFPALRYYCARSAGKENTADFLQ